MECLVRRRQVRGFRSIENQAFTFVNNYFQNKSNEEIGVFWQALIRTRNQRTMNLKPEIKHFIKNNPSLFWYIPKDKREEISNDLLLESVLNYGTLNDCLMILKLIGLKESYKILQEAKGRKKGNYYPEIYNFFNLFLSKNA